MAASIAAAMEKAKQMKSKKQSKGKLVHPSFPPQASAQPSHLGSQSMSPTPMGGAQDQMLDPSNPAAQDQGIY